MSDLSTQVYVEGELLAGFGPWDDLEVIQSHRGPERATWSMPLRERDRPEPLVRNAWVDIYEGPRLCWSGALSAPDLGAGTFEAVGIARLAEGAECLTAARQITSKPNTAIDQSAARGVWPVVRGSDFGNTDLAGPEGAPGVDDPQPGKLSELLSQWEIENYGKQWRVSPSGLVTHYTASETAVDWLILPGIAVMGVADDDVTDAVFLRYFDSAAGQNRTAYYPATTPEGGVERRASITHLGPMNLTRATAIAQGMWRRLQEGRTGWTNGIEATAGQIITPGGLPADLSQVLGGHTVQCLDTPDPRHPGRDLTVVLDETRWVPGDPLIQMNPVGLVPATWEQVMKEANARGDD